MPKKKKIFIPQKLQEIVSVCPFDTKTGLIFLFQQTASWSDTCIFVAKKLLESDRDPVLFARKDPFCFAIGLTSADSFGQAGGLGKTDQWTSAFWSKVSRTASILLNWFSGFILYFPPGLIASCTKRGSWCQGQGMEGDIKNLLFVVGRNLTVTEKTSRLSAHSRCS